MKLNAEIACPSLGQITLDRHERFVKHMTKHNLEYTIRNRVEYFTDKNETKFNLNFTRIQECTSGEENPTDDYIYLTKNDISDKYNHDYETGNVECSSREEFILFAEQLHAYYSELFKDFNPHDKSLATWIGLE